jgi:hypothetical protein
MIRSYYQGPRSEPKWYDKYDAERAVALHEAAHAVVGHLAGGKIIDLVVGFGLGDESVRIFGDAHRLPDNERCGFFRCRMPPGTSQWCSLLMMLAGGIAGGSSSRLDIEQARQRATAIDPHDVDRVIEHARETATRLVSKNWDAIDDLAGLVLGHGGRLTQARLNLFFVSVSADAEDRALLADPYAATARHEPARSPVVHTDTTRADGWMGGGQRRVGASMSRNGGRCDG